MSDPAPLGKRPRFFCQEEHGQTNQVIALGGATFCLECLTACAKDCLPQAIKIAED